MKGIYLTQEGKQETIEQAAERFYPINSNSSAMEMLDRHQLNNSYKQEGFIAGVNWQSERMYSEEGVLKILRQFNKDKPKLIFGVEEWFEQIKKK